MRRITSILLICMLCVSLFAACSSNGGDSVTPTDVPNTSDNTSPDENSGGDDGVLSSIYSGELEKNVTIRVLENDTAIEQGYFAELIAAFNEEYKDYGITAVDANMDQYSNLADDGPYGYGPDVLYQANDILMKYVEGRHIYPIPVQQLECYDKIPENAWNAFASEVDGIGYHMGVPVNVQSGMLYYRKDMLPENWETEWDDNANGIPDMAETWNDLYRYSKSIVDSGQKKFGYMKSLYDVYFSSGFLFSYGAYIFGNNNTDVKDIGFSAGNAEMGANILLKFANLMNEECIDNSINTNCYSKIAEGTYFATLTTPDVYTLFLKELSLAYQAQGMSAEEALALAEENLVITNPPMLPSNGDITSDTDEFIPLKAMGGINGYAISAYTKSPNACLAFVEFASGYEMVKKRNEMLGIVPARSDAAAEAGEVAVKLFESLDAGNIVVMPSVTGMAQVWTPGETFFQDLAKDAFRSTDKKFTSLELIKAGLKEVDKQIYDAINTLNSN